MFPPPLYLCFYKARGEGKWTVGMVGPTRLASGVWGSLNTGGQPGAPGQPQPSSLVTWLPTVSWVAQASHLSGFPPQHL